MKLLVLIAVLIVCQLAASSSVSSPSWVSSPSSESSESSVSSAPEELYPVCPYRFQECQPHTVGYCYHYCDSCKNKLAVCAPPNWQAPEWHCECQPLLE